MSKFSNMNFHVLTAWINMAPAVQKLAWNLFNECCRRYDLGIILTPVSIIRDFTLSGKTKLYGWSSSEYYCIIYDANQPSNNRYICG